ncbi:MAG: GNAT family N-acetyltransferase [Treponema sp.]|jgi:Leu/Phe-tRNA-protein transferase|nr:GNAT family N-acetyltransferase [Treponema sp.]
MLLRYTRSGHLFISTEDDCHAIVDAMLATDYNEDFCIAVDFSPEFIARLMEAGFLVMSANIGGDDDEKQDFILLPKLHLERSVLFFENLHIKKSIRRFLSRYELRPDAEFDHIIERCVQKHGGDWLTPPLIECIKDIRASHPDGITDEGRLVPTVNAYPASFALYRDGKLVAGEFGVVCGSVYTSYSGFFDEDNAGSVQLILSTLHLQEQGFSFLDLGMPMDYKTTLGAVDINTEEFVRLFRGMAPK